MNINGNNNKLYQLISGCINAFKKIPKTIENFFITKSLSQLRNLIGYANAFANLSNYIVENFLTNNENLQVFHRFYCRIREIICSYLGFYITTHAKLIIKDFLIQTNKEILTFRPDTDPITILKKINQSIISCIRTIATNQKVKQQEVQQIFTQRRIVLKRPDPPSTREQPLYLRQKGLPKNIEEEVEAMNMIKSCGFDIISNLDERHYERCSRENEQQLMKNYMNRNRNIKFQITRYSLNFDVYESKPEEKKNRPHSVYQPTTKIKSHSKKKSQKTSRRSSMDKSSNTSFSLRNNSTTYQSCMYDNPDELMREQLLKHITERKKIYPSRITITGNDLCFKPNPKTSHRTVKGESTNKFYKRAKKGVKIGYQLYSQVTRHNSISFAM